MEFPLLIGLATAAVAGTVVVFLMFSGSGDPETRPAATPQFPDSVQTSMALDTLGDTTGLTLIDTAADTPSERMDFEEFEDEPPRPARRPPARRVSAPVPSDEPDGEPLPSIAAAPPAPATGGTGGRLQITVDRPIGGSETGGGLFELGLAAQRRGDYLAAKNYYLQATFASPRNPELYNNLGTAYRALNELPAAEAAYKHATELDSRFAPAWNNLGIVLAQQGRAQEAMTALQEAVRLDPLNSGAKVNLAIQLNSAGAVADARRMLEEAGRADPAMPEAHYELGRVLEKLNDRAGAVREYKIFLSTAGGRFPALEQAVRGRLLTLEQ